VKKKYFLLCLLLFSFVSACEPPVSTSSKKNYKAGADQVLELRENKDFETLVLKKKGVVLVKFYTEQCPACKALAPIIQEIAGKYKKKIDVIKVDCNKFPKLSINYDIAAVPAVFIFKDGQILEKIIGLQKKEVYETFINKAL
jgi:thioredoxin 1